MKRLCALAALIAATGPAAAQNTAAPWITTREPLTLFSANDGDTHLRVDDAMRQDRVNVTEDSITVIHLGPDHPPVVKTVYGTVPNSITGSPYIAMSRDGRYGFVTSNAAGLSAGEPENLLSVVDLASDDLAVIQKVEIPRPSMVDVHPDGRVIVSCATGFQVFEIRDGKLVLFRDNKTTVLPGGSIDISPKGDRIVATQRGGGGGGGGGGRVQVYSYRDGVIEHAAEVQIKAGLPGFRQPFSPRFSPDGRRAIVLNGGGTGTKGSLDEVLSVDMTLNPPTVTEVIPQVADGMEGVAFHPKGHMVVVACLEETRMRAHLTYSHLAVIDLTSRPMRLMYYLDVEAIPEGIEFTPDGTQLFVGLTSANRYAVFDVDRFLLTRSPFVMRVGHAPSAAALGRRYQPTGAGRR
jgi:DNA-binding beta-propeller fold protein YncE